MHATRTASLVLGSLVLGSLVLVSLVVTFGAHAQDAPPGPARVTETELRNAQTAIERQLDAEGWVAADALLDPIEDRLVAWEDWAHAAQLGCQRAVLHLRQPHAMTTEYLREIRQDAGNGLASATDEPRRLACLRRVGLAFAHYAELPELGDVERRLARESAIVWISRARALHDDDALHQAYDAQPAELRAEIEALLTAIRGGPIARAVGVQANADALASALARAAYLQSPLRQGSCGQDSAVTPTRDGALMIVCVFEIYPLRGLSSIHPSERWLVEPTEGGVRAIAMMRDMDLRDGVRGMVHEVRTFQRLTAAQHGFDGYLFSWREGYELEGERRIESYVTVCDRTSGLCQRLDIGRDTCLPDLRARPQCTEGWEADTNVADGQLVLSRTRRPRRGARHDAFPADFELRHDLRRAMGVNAAREGTPVLVPDPPIGSHCRLVVTGRGATPARSSPSARGTSAGTVPNGTVIVPTDRRIGWVRALAPVDGWLPSSSVARTCD